MLSLVWTLLAVKCWLVLHCLHNVRNWLVRLQEEVEEGRAMECGGLLTVQFCIWRFVLCVSVLEAKVYCVYNVDSEFVLCFTMVIFWGFYMYSYIMSIRFLLWVMSSVHTWKEWWSGSEFPSPQFSCKALVDIFLNFGLCQMQEKFYLHWNWYLHNEHLPLTTNIVTQ